MQLMKKLSLHTQICMLWTVRIALVGSEQDPHSNFLGKGGWTAIQSPDLCIYFSTRARVVRFLYPSQRLQKLVSGLPPVHPLR